MRLQAGYNDCDLSMYSGLKLGGLETIVEVFSDTQVILLHTGLVLWREVTAH